MTQGYTGTQPSTRPISIADTPSRDAFSRLRVTNINGLWDAQLTYDLQPLLFEQITNGPGATVAHDSTERGALMTFSSTTTGGLSYLQSYSHIRYQPGKSQLVFISFNFVTSVADCLKFVGYSDGTNGIEFQDDGGTIQWKVYSGTTAGDQTADQSSWNLDKLDGTGPSGVTLDLTKVQLAVIDFQALYVGRIRVGFDIGGDIIYVHQFLDANVLAYSWIQSANLPVRAGMSCTGTVSTTMYYYCCAVSTEGVNDQSPGYSFSASNSVTAGNGTRTHLMSIRPKTTFNGITNRIKFVLDNIDIAVTGSNAVFWELCIGQALTTPSYADVNATYSSFEYDTAGTLSGSPAIVIASGYVSASNQAKGSISRSLSTKYPITLDAAGAVRNLGTLTLLVTGIGATSATTASINFTEAR